MAPIVAVSITISVILGKEQNDGSIIYIESGGESDVMTWSLTYEEDNDNSTIQRQERKSPCSFNVFTSVFSKYNMKIIDSGGVIAIR